MEKETTVWNSNKKVSIWMAKSASRKKTERCHGPLLFFLIFFISIYRHEVAWEVPIQLISIPNYIDHIIQGFADHPYQPNISKTERGRQKYFRQKL